MKSAIAPQTRILAIMEAKSVTGPAKNLIAFGQWLLTPEGRDTGIDLAVATYQRHAHGPAVDGFIHAVRDAGVRLFVIPENRRFDLGVAARLRQAVETFNPQILQTHNNKSHLLIRYMKRMRQSRRWIAFHHGEVHSDLKQRIYNNVDRLTLRRADTVVTVCDAFSGRLVDFGVRNERIRVLHNSIAIREPSSLEIRSTWRERLGVGPGTALILSVGRLSAEKGHDDLLRALAKLPPRPHNWRLVVVGDGPERNALTELSKSLGIRDQVDFTGFVGGVGDLLSSADLFVLPSRSEGSSNALLEAMSAGLPIVATAAGGNPEILIHEQSGLITASRDPAALAGAIDRLLSDPDLARQLSATARARAKTEFSPEEYRRRLLGIYGERVQGHTPAVG